MKIVEFKDYDNQTTPLSAYNLNRLQQNLITTKYQMTFSSAVSGGSTITLPCYYQVGQDTLDVYLNSELLKKASTKDSEGHYYEVGNSDTKSNQIKITSDWSIASGDVLNLIVRGTTDSYDQNLSPDKATQLADEISANKEEITALQTENSRLKGITNALPKISGEDTSLTLTNTANAPLSDIILKGNSSQNTTTGKNLLPNDVETKTENGLTITKNDDGTYTINGTATADLSTAVNNDFIPMSGTWRMLGCPSGGSSSTYMLSAYVGYWGGDSPNIDTGNGTNITYTGNVKVRFFIKSGTVCNNLIFKPMLTTDTSATIDDFEPYTGGIASPNPSYPQDIEVVTGNNKIIVSGKNLLPPYNNTSTTINGVTFTRNSDGSVLVNGTATANAQYITSQNFMLEDGKTYILSGCPNGGSTSTYMLNINQYYNKTSHILNNIGYDKEFTYVLDSKDSNSIFIYIVSGTKCDNLLFKPMVSINGGDYEPVRRQDFPISLGSLELCKIGDYQDYIYKSNDKWYKHKVIDKNTLNGTERWHLGKNKTNFTAIFTSSFQNVIIKIPANSNINANTLIYCDKFSNNTTPGQQWVNDTMSSVTLNDARNITFNIPNSIATTLDEFKTYLSSNNTIIYYVLATPIEEEIIDTTLISQLNALYNAYTYNDTTNITQTNANLPFYINAEAFKKIS